MVMNTVNCQWVERHTYRLGELTVNPDFPVLDGVEEVLQIEFMSQRRAVFFEAANDLVLFGRGQELGRVRVVVHDKVSNNGYKGDPPRLAMASLENGVWQQGKTHRR